MRPVVCAVLLLLLPVTFGAQTPKSTGALTPQIESVLRSIKEADKGLLAVSE
jgi:hypothetical protein